MLLTRARTRRRERWFVGSSSLLLRAALRRRVTPCRSVRRRRESRKVIRSHRHEPRSSALTRGDQLVTLRPGSGRIRLSPRPCDPRTPRIVAGGRLNQTPHDPAMSLPYEPAASVRIPAAFRFPGHRRRQPVSRSEMGRVRAWHFEGLRDRRDVFPKKAASVPAPSVTFSWLHWTFNGFGQERSQTPC